MAELVELELENVAFEDQDYQEDEELERGSLHHGIAQANLTVLCFNDKRFRVITELSLDASQIDLKPFGIKAKEELIPDLCVYPKANSRSKKGRDIMKMSEMPLFIIEILSPKQGIDDILAKFEAYFALGVKSCWLVMPIVETVTVYSKIDEYKSFGMNDTEVIDEVINIRLPTKMIFEW